jgi:hypothetical protein
MKYIAYILFITLIGTLIWVILEVEQLTKDIQTVGTIFRGSGIVEVLEDGNLKVNQLND